MKLSIKFKAADGLKQQIHDIGSALFGPTGQGPEAGGSIALFSSEELVAELAVRQVPPMELHVGPPPGMTSGGVAPASGNGAEPAVAPAAKKRGRPPKPKAVAAAAGATAADADQANPPAIDPAALPNGPKAPDTSAAAVAPELPTEDDLLALMSDVYSSSGDMMLVRGIMSEIGGKTNLSQIPTKFWPELNKRLLAEQARLKAPQ